MRCGFGGVGGGGVPATRDCRRGRYCCYPRRSQPGQFKFHGSWAAKAGAADRTGKDAGVAQRLGPRRASGMIQARLRWSPLPVGPGQRVPVSAPRLIITAL